MRKKRASLLVKGLKIVKIKLTQKTFNQRRLL